MAKKVNVNLRNAMKFGRKKTEMPEGKTIGVISLAKGVSAAEFRNAILHGATVFEEIEGTPKKKRAPAESKKGLFGLGADKPEAKRPLTTEGTEKEEKEATVSG